MSEHTKEPLSAWSDDTALMGPEAPQWDGRIEHLIRYLLTVHKRFGNTAVTASLQWGASALWKHDEQAKRIAELEQQRDELLAALEKALAALETCTPADYSTGHVIHASFDDAACAWAEETARAAIVKVKP